MSEKEKLEEFKISRKEKIEELNKLIDEFDEQRKLLISFFENVSAHHYLTAQDHVKAVYFEDKLAQIADQYFNLNYELNEEYKKWKDDK